MNQGYYFENNAVYALCSVSTHTQIGMIPAKSVCPDGGGMSSFAYGCPTVYTWLSHGIVPLEGCGMSIGLKWERPAHCTYSLSFQPVLYACIPTVCTLVWKGETGNIPTCDLGKYYIKGAIPPCDNMG